MSVEIRIPKNYNIIDVNDAGELIWWSNHLGVSPEKLLSITNKVGPSRKDVRNFITPQNNNGRSQ
ncbi:MAG: hypothetical protein JWP81_5359 [Ferruginibacter sp.]|nr:hypothetical protein [Ferruginibacter sp.]